MASGCNRIARYGFGHAKSCRIGAVFVRVDHENALGVHKPKGNYKSLVCLGNRAIGLLFGSFWSWDSSWFVKIWHILTAVRTKWSNWGFSKIPNFGRLLFCVQTPVEARTGFVETPHVSSIDSCSFYGSGYRSDNVFNRIKLAIFRKTRFLGTE